MQAKEINWFKKQLRERPVPVWMIEFRTGSLSVPERQEETESSEAVQIQEHQASRGMPHTLQCSPRRGRKPLFQVPSFLLGIWTRSHNFSQNVKNKDESNASKNEPPPRTLKQASSIKASHIVRPAEILSSPITLWMQVLKPTGHINSRDICKHSLRQHQELRAPFPKGAAETDYLG